MLGFMTQPFSKNKKEAMAECMNLYNIERKSLHNVIIFGRENP
jgi:hypothetical protein